MSKLVKKLRNFKQAFYWEETDQFYKEGDKVKITTVSLSRSRKEHIGRIVNFDGRKITLDCSDTFFSKLVEIKVDSLPFIIDIQRIEEEENE